MSFELHFAGCPEKFANGKGGMTGFIDPGRLTRSRSYGSVFVKMLEIVA